MNFINLYRNRVFLIVSLLLSFQAVAQVNQDSVNQVHPIKLSTDFDQRFSFIHGQSVNIWGQRAGLLIKESFKTGFGIYYLSDVVSHSVIYPNLSKIYTNRKLEFGTIYFEPFLLRKKYWELSVPFEIGYGKSIYNTYDSLNNDLIRIVKKDFVPTGAGLSLTLKLPTIKHFTPLRWIGINFLVGYRYCLFEKYLKTRYNGSFWSIGGAIFLDRIQDDYRTWKKRKISEAE